VIICRFTNFAVRTVKRFLKPLLPHATLQKKWPAKNAAAKKYRKPFPLQAIGFLLPAAVFRPGPYPAALPVPDSPERKRSMPVWHERKSPVAILRQPGFFINYPVR